MKTKKFTSMGLMSGTSMDGIDLSIIKSDGYDQFTSILDNYFEFDKELRMNLIDLRKSILTSDDLNKFYKELGSIEKKFTLFNGQIIEKVLKNFDEDIDLIGFHGQTIFHDSNKKITKQIGDGKLLSQMTKKIVVNDFRQQDLINNGQGAPLTPIFHKLLSKFLNREHNLNFPLNVVNVGGITNVTKIYNDSFSLNSNLKAFDIAPGNCLVDEWIRKNSNHRFDKGGQIGRSGKVDDLILNQALENFNITDYNNSLDIKDFDISFAKGLSLEDGCATITKFTANLIAEGIKFVNKLDNSLSKNNLICGGGRKNIFLIDCINENLSQNDLKLEDLDLYGFDGDFTESQAFGFIAIRSFLKLPISFPGTTRCKKPTIGGKINKNF